MNKKKKLPIIATVSPATIWMILFVVLSVVYIVLISFIKTNNRELIFQFTLDNYKSAFSPLYASIYVNSFSVALLNTLICILLGYPMAYIMVNSSKRRKSLYMTLMMLPFYTNLIIRINGWQSLLGRTGYLNSFLISIGLIDKPITFMYTQGAVVLGMVYSLLPFMVLPLISSIGSVDKSLLEASKDLGASKVKTFINVMLPLTKSGIFAGTIMVFIPTMAYFFISELMGGAKHKLIGNLIQTEFIKGNNWPLGAAFSVILVVITLIMVGVYKKTGGDMDSLGGV